jgi:hypothetical protein
MTIFGRHPARHQPQHARTSLLAPSRTLTAVVGLLTAIGLTIAGCARGATGSAKPRAHAAPVPIGAAVGPAVPLDPAAQLGGPNGLSAADISARGGGPVVFSARTAAARAAQPGASMLAASGIPSTALAAYRAAATREAARTPACGLSWPLLAGIGRVESNHGRFAGAVLHTDGVSTPPIIGIPLNGNGTAVIRDSDGGRMDGDTTYDRAVGPMQFIPTTWAGWGVDANHDGRKDPFNVFDAAAAAADYLCAAGRNLTTTHGQVLAILSYNHSYDYVKMVMGLEKVYAAGVGVTVPVLPTTAGPVPPPTLPPVDPGTPRGATTPPKPSSSTAKTPPSSPPVTSSAPATPSSSTPPAGSVPPSSTPPTSSPAPSSPAPSCGADSSSPSTSPSPSPSGSPSPSPSCDPSSSSSATAPAASAASGSGP